jgi:hypothetical protein
LLDQEQEDDMKNAAMAEGFTKSVEIPSVTFVCVAVPTALADEIQAEIGGFDASMMKKILEKGLSRIRAEKKWAEKHGTATKAEAKRKTSKKGS